MKHKKPDIIKKAIAELDRQFNLPVEPGHKHITTIDAGAVVFCDFCCTEYTHRNDSGGFYFDGYSVCPKCAPKSLKEMKESGEDKLITAWCPKGKSFRDWVLIDLRKGNNQCIITTSE